jgi:hypothetical protein
MSGLYVKFANPEVKKDDDYNHRSTLGYICLAYIPVGIGFSNILLRKMKGLHFIQLSLYKIFIALIITSGICYINHDTLRILWRFSSLDFTYLIVGSIFQ